MGINIFFISGNKYRPVTLIMDVSLWKVWIKRIYTQIIIQQMYSALVPERDENHIITSQKAVNN